MGVPFRRALILGSRVLKCGFVLRLALYFVFVLHNFRIQFHSVQYTPAVEGYQLMNRTSDCWTFVDAIMSGSVGGNLFSKHSYLFVNFKNSEIYKRSNPCQAQMKLF
jgi:hypothetical protein